MKNEDIIRRVERFRGDVKLGNDEYAAHELEKLIILLVRSLIHPEEDFKGETSNSGYYVLRNEDLDIGQELAAYIDAQRGTRAQVILREREQKLAQLAATAKASLDDLTGALGEPGWRAVTGEAARDAQRARLTEHTEIMAASHTLTQFCSRLAQCHGVESLEEFIAAGEE